MRRVMSQRAKADFQLVRVRAASTALQQACCKANRQISAFAELFGPAAGRHPHLGGDGTDFAKSPQ